MKRKKIFELSTQGLERFIEINGEWANTHWLQFRKRYKLWKEIKRLK